MINSIAKCRFNSIFKLPILYFFSSSSQPSPSSTSYKPPIPTTPIDDYQLTAFLGKGSTSRVYSGFNILTSRPVILKMFKSQIAQSKIFHQIHIHSLIQSSPHIRHLVDVVRDPACGSYVLVFQNNDGVPMNQIKKMIDFDQGLIFMRDVLRGVRDCHEKGVIHRDIKRANILIEGNKAKLFDFGLGKIVGVDQLKGNRFGTKCYYTPQMIFKKPTYDHKVDLWTTGLIFAQILSQKYTLMPYTSDEQTMTQIIQFSGYSPKIIPKNLSHLQDQARKRVSFAKLLKGKHPDKEYTDKIATILHKMMDIDPEKRPQAKDLLKEDVFANLGD